MEEYLRKYYPVAQIAYKWSSQYYVPVDGFPNIGLMPGEKHILLCYDIDGKNLTGPAQQPLEKILFPQ